MAPRLLIACVLLSVLQPAAGVFAQSKHSLIRRVKEEQERERQAASRQPAAPAAAAPAVKARLGSIFEPSQFKSLGRLAVPAGSTIVFNTGAAGAAPTVSGTFSGTGQLGVSQSGKVQLAVFCFDDVSLAAGSTVQVTGDRGLVLLSKGNIAIGTTIDLSGGAGKPHARDSVGGSGGPGGEGGERGQSHQSNPPPATGGDGGPAVKDRGQPGYGFGAGFNQRCKGGVAGGGGGYGGAGGETSEGSKVMGAKGPAPMPGGPLYGDPALKDLFGGSGGAGGSNDRSFDSASGGGGGGAIALIALRVFSVGAGGKILANGGEGGVLKTCGGGGSGGGILIAAPTIQLAKGALIHANGGGGGSVAGVAAEIAEGNTRRQLGNGGGGGGGRIAVYSRMDPGDPGKNKVETRLPSAISISGGKAGEKAEAGKAGTFYDGTFPAIR